MKITLEHREGTNHYYAWYKRHWWSVGTCLAAAWGRDECIKKALERLNHPETDPKRPNRKIREDVEIFRVEQ